MLDDPEDHEHALFYLGQSHLMAGNVEEARRWWLRLVELDTPTDKPHRRGERVYQAMQLLARTGPEEERVDWLVRAARHRPQRQEARLKAVVHLREMGELQRASELLDEVAWPPTQPPDLMGLQPWVYEWGLGCEKVAVALMKGDQAAAAREARRLITCPTLPDAQRQALRSLALAS
jgi:hypothetical protein